MEAIIGSILGHIGAAAPVAQQILMAIGSLVVIMSAYIAATPSKEDDAWFDKVEAIPYLGAVIQALTRFSVVVRKDP